jgi:hypothetical protein
LAAWAGFFVKRDKLLSKLIKFKYENIKYKKKMRSGTCLTSKLYDTIIKTPLKSHETIPVNWRLAAHYRCCFIEIIHIRFIFRLYTGTYRDYISRDWNSFED